MQPLRIDLFGGFALHTDGDRPCPLPVKKAQALLAYLALPPGRPHSRDKLATLFWGDTPETQARQALRQTLTRLRRALGDVASDVLVDGPDTLALDPARVRIDVVEFEAAAIGEAPEALARAAELYRGDLLDGLDVSEPTFEEWRTVERERLRELALEALTKLLRHHVHAEALDAAVQTALRILALDPLEEAVHRALMRLYGKQGRRAAALRQYQECVQTLQRELGAEPEEATREIYRQLLRGGDAEAARPRFASAVDGLRLPGAPRGVLIGRSSALAELERSLEHALDGGGRIVLVRGEAGIGKTRLLEALTAVALARSVTVVAGRCYETEQPLPLRPWIDALRAAPAMRDPALLARLTVGARLQLGRVFSELARADEPAPPAVGDQPQLFDAIAELARQLGSDGPVLIVLEDLHWADATSVRLLAFLGRRLGALPVLIVGTIRPEEASTASVLEPAVAELRASGMLDEISVGPLNMADTLALARALWSGGRDPAIVEQIAGDLWALSEGNPFVIVEAVRGLAEHRRDDAQRRELLSRSVRDSIAARLGRLSATSRRVVAVAAVINRAFSLPLLRQAAGLDEEDAARAVEELVRRRVLDTVGEQLDFCHDRIRRVAYEDILPARRGSLHGAVARALAAGHGAEPDEVADQLGHHYVQAGEIERALPHLTRFAEIAMQRYAVEAALAALHDAEATVDRLPAAQRDRHRLDIALRQAFVLAVRGRQRECLALLQAHAEVQQRVPDAALASEYFFRLAMTHAYLSDWAQWRPAGEAALRAAEQSGEPERVGKALYSLAAGSYASGATQDAIAFSSRAVDVLGHPGSRHWQGLAYWNLAANQLLTGEFDAAMLNAGRCLKAASATGDSRLQAIATYVEAWVLASRGEGEVAVARAREALDIARDPIATNTALLALGYAHVQAGDSEGARQVFDDLLQRIESAVVRFTLERALPWAAEAYLLQGDHARAASTAERAMELARASGNRYSIGIAERAGGRVLRAAGDGERAAAAFSLAFESLQSFGAAFEAGVTRLDLARVLVARGDRAMGRAHVLGAIPALETAGAARRATEARELARSLEGPP